MKIKPTIRFNSSAWSINIGEASAVKSFFEGEGLRSNSRGDLKKGKVMKL
jgi:hypothetical protein